MSANKIDNKKQPPLPPTDRIVVSHERGDDLTIEYFTKVPTTPDSTAEDDKIERHIVEVKDGEIVASEGSSKYDSIIKDMVLERLHNRVLQTAGNYKCWEEVKKDPYKMNAPARFVDTAMNSGIALIDTGKDPAFDMMVLSWQEAGIEFVFDIEQSSELAPLFLNKP